MIAREQQVRQSFGQVLPDETVTATESDYFICLATLSLSFLGFSAVVVSLRAALGGETSDRHLRLVRLYIEGGLIVTALALVPALLNLLHVSGPYAVALAGALCVFRFIFVRTIDVFLQRARA